MVKRQLCFISQVLHDSYLKGFSVCEESQTILPHFRHTVSANWAVSLEQLQYGCIILYWVLKLWKKNE